MTIGSQVLRNRLGVFWHRHMGRPAWVALALVLAVGVVQWRVLPTLTAEQQRLETRLLRLPAGSLSPMASMAPAAALAAQAPAGLELPSDRQRAADIELLVETAQRNGLTLERADYTLAPPNGNAAARLQATLPLSGTYTGLRRYIAAVLNALPHSALESLSIERADAQATQLQATARLVLFYRPEAP
jgi:hypothetical protein